MKKVTLVTGGARSGKSRFALDLLAHKRHPAFIATAEATDAEMVNRIQAHRAQRADSVGTIEEPLFLADALLRVPWDTEIALIDCLTVWMGNLMHHRGMRSHAYDEVTALLELLPRLSFDVVLVSNELGMGIVPENPMARWFRDAAGRLNQDVAAIATEVVFMVSGCPFRVKGPVKRQ